MLITVVFLCDILVDIWISIVYIGGVVISVGSGVLHFWSPVPGRGGASVWVGTCHCHCHLNDTAHRCGPINDIMQVVQCHKGPHLNTIERFHIHAESSNNNHLNEGHTIFPNAIFEILLRNNHKTPPDQQT
jgi:hypothetical protein